MVGCPAGPRNLRPAWHDSAMAVTVDRERPDAPEVSAIIVELEDHLAGQYPAESRHGFSVERLIADDVHLFVVRVDGAPVGCGGTLFVDGPGEPYGEIKRMYVRPDARGAGHGRRILETLVAHARAQGVRMLRLETGIHQVEAIGLYEAMGFRPSAPFGPYRDDPLSPCYELRLG
jgi:GNAT superfamily N-acetyltransferase